MGTTRAADAVAHYVDGPVAPSIHQCPHFGAHGRFDARARKRSAQWFIAKHRSVVAIVVLILVALVAVHS